MSTAILTGQPVPGSSIEADLRSLGFDVRIAPDTATAGTLLAEVPAGQRVAVVDARFVGHEHALRLGLTDPRFPLAAIPGAVTAQPAARQALSLAMDRATAGEDTAVSEPAAEVAEATGTTEPAAPEAVTGDAGETASGGAPAPAGTTLTGDLSDRIVAALSADGSDPHRPDLGSLVATVPDDPQARNEARQAVAAVDDEAVRLKSAVKARDGFFTTYCISPYSRYLARWCARRGLTPNQVTTASLFTALIAAACAATGTRAGFVAAGVLLLASFVLDCTDGQFARSPCSTPPSAPGSTPPSTAPRSTPTTRASPSARPAAATTYRPSPSARWSCRPAGTSWTSPSTRRTPTAPPPPVPPPLSPASSTASAGRSGHAA
ncbi:hypothetical protein SHIRM173S_07261 [Streptomyces hirsutus]